jgi:hypothetical protein
MMLKNHMEPYAPPRPGADQGGRSCAARNDLQNQLICNLQWNNQMKNIDEIPWHTPTTFQQFFNWMNQKKRVDYLINQNRNSIIAHEVEQSIEGMNRKNQVYNTQEMQKN